MNNPTDTNDVNQTTGSLNIEQADVKQEDEVEALRQGNISPEEVVANARKGIASVSYAPHLLKEEEETVKPEQRLRQGQ